MVVIRAKNINEAYLEVLKKIFKQDEKGNYVNAYITGIDSGSFGKNEETKDTGQKRLQIDLLSVEIEHPDARPLQIIIPKAAGMPVINDLEYIEGYTRTKVLSSILAKNEIYTYGSRVFEFPAIERCSEYNGCKSKDYGCYGERETCEEIYGFNQFEWVVDHFKKSPQNNHCCIQIATGNDLKLKHAPCLRLIDLKMVEGRLNMTLYFRSWDLYTGFPSNLAAFQLMNEALVEEIGGGVTTGKLFGVSSGAHIYSSAWDEAKKAYQYYVLGEGR